MGNEIAKEKLYSSIAKNKQSKIITILTQYPDLVNQVLTKDSKMTPLLKAITHDNLQVIQLLLETFKADYNHSNTLGITPLMLSCIKNNIELVKYFVQKHNVNQTSESSEGLTALDYAIYAGNYQIAQYLHKFKTVKPKEIDVYEEIRKKQRGRYVNYAVFILHLQKQLEPESLPEYLQPVKPIIKDPVIDPRQNWKQFASRILNFDPPPIIERKELPEELRPENRSMISRLRTRIENGKSQINSIQEFNSERHPSPIRENDNPIIAHLKRTGQMSGIELRGL